MYYVCENCGQYRADQCVETTAQSSYAVCPACGFRRPFLRLPLYIVGGASGTGKSRICLALAGRLPEAVVLEFGYPLDGSTLPNPDQYAAYFELWLRMCKNIAQSGRPVMLFGAGLGVPGNIEPLVARRYFSQVHYLALCCEDDTLAERLRARPSWRGADAEEWIASQVSFNRWYREQAPRQPRLNCSTPPTPARPRPPHRLPTGFTVTPDRRGNCSRLLAAGQTQ